MSGQIGSYLLRDLSLSSAIIYNLGRTPVAGTIHCPCDLTDGAGLRSWLLSISPDEIYHLAAQSDAGISMQEPELTMLINGNVVLTICEVVRQRPTTRVFFANSAELYRGLPGTEVMITEDSLLMMPINPYGIAKMMAYWTVRYYRQTYGLYLCNGIIFTTESPRRKPGFAMKKITTHLREDRLLTVGDLAAQRDWIHAADVASAMHLILQQPGGDDYVIALGELHSIQETIEYASQHCGRPLVFRDNKGYHGEELKVVAEPELYRRQEVATLRGNSSKLRSCGWQPRYRWEDIVEEMVK